MMVAASTIQVAGCMILRCTQKDAEIITPFLVVATGVLISLLLAVLAENSGLLSDNSEIQLLGSALAGVPAE